MDLNILKWIKNSISEKFLTNVSMIPKLIFLFSSSYLLVLIQLKKLKNKVKREEFSITRNFSLWLLEKVKIFPLNKRLKKVTKMVTGSCLKIFI